MDQIDLAQRGEKITSMISGGIWPSSGLAGPRSGLTADGLGEDERWGGLGGLGGLGGVSERLPMTFLLHP